MIDVLVCGISGKMGMNVADMLKGDGDARVVCGVDLHKAENCGVPVYTNFKDVKEHVDVIIDFSSPAALRGELEWAVAHKINAVIAATGYSADDGLLIERAAEKIAIFKTANLSLGVNLINELVKKAAAALGEKFDIEIIERHHNQKTDAPSGTALMLAESANSAFGSAKQTLNGRCGAVGKRGKEIGVHAVRGGTIVGEHEVMFAGDDEIITISHSARSKRVFAAGAVKASKWLKDKPAGIYDMNDLIKD